MQEFDKAATKVLLSPWRMYWDLEPWVFERARKRGVPRRPWQAATKTLARNPKALRQSERESGRCCLTLTKRTDIVTDC
jgi:hypothetical protein